MQPVEDRSGYIETEETAVPGVHVEALEVSPAAVAAKGRTDPHVAWPIAALVLAAAFMALTQGSFNLFLFNSFLLAAIGATALNLAMGSAGLVSVATAGFLLTGSFTGVAVSEAGYPMPVAAICAAVTAGAMGGLFALPSARLDGLYFALSTLAAQTILVHFAREYQREEVGESGFIGVPYFSEHGVLGQQRAWAVLLVGIVIVVLLLAAALRRGRSGRAVRFVRDHQLAASATGVRIGRWKVWVMVISSALMGVQGCLMFYLSGTSSFASFTFLLSVQYIAMVLLGGSDSLVGPLLGAGVVVMLPHWTQDVVEQVFGADVALQNGSRIAQILYGLIIIIAIVGPADGLDGGVRRIARNGRQVLRAGARLFVSPAESGRTAQ